MARQARMFVGPREIAGYYAGLARGFDANGYACDFLTFPAHPYAYGGESQMPMLLRLARALPSIRGTGRRPGLWSVLRSLPAEIVYTLWAVSAIFRYDVFIFGFGSSLLWSNLDLPALRFLGKMVIANLGHGSEARPPYMNGALQAKDGGGQLSPARVASLARSRAATVARFERYASVVIGAPFSTSQFASKRFVNHFSLGHPLAIRDDHVGAASEMPHDASTGVRILHSPSHPAAKGTSLIVAAIERLKARGHRIELVLLAGRPHREVVQGIKQCDFVVDQVFSDTPMAGFAAEAAWFGKPAVVGGYGLDELRSFVPAEMWPPTKTCHPSMMESAIEALIVDPDERMMLGNRAKAFVRVHWVAEEVARRYLRLIEGDIPDDWWVDPKSVRYLAGACQSIERTAGSVRRLVERYGVCSLQLRDRPDLEKALLELSEYPTAR